MKNWRKRLGWFVMLMFLLIGLKGMEAQAKAGVTGLPMIVPVGVEDAFVLEEDAGKVQIKGVNGATFSRWNLPKNGLYDWNGQIVYLYNGRLQKYCIIDGFYCNQDGIARPYTEETKPALDAEIQYLYNTKIPQIKATYGVDFNFRPGYSLLDNLRFAVAVEDIFKACPEGSIPLITAGSKRTTGKTLKIKQRFEVGEGVFLDGSVSTGIYSSGTNQIQSIAELDTLIHEMGHSYEATLNHVAGGKLKATFTMLNGGVAYSKYYYYAGGDPAIYGTIPVSFRRDYAATSYQEDFAETFVDAVALSSEELAREVGLGTISMEYFQKVLYVKQLFNQGAGAIVLP